MHDLVIRGGNIVNGTGDAPFVADVAVDGDTITMVGPGAGRARLEIDADGHVVTPGFVDIHTHLDAQIGWDPFLTPLGYHGVTTALLGNCGVTFAPVREGDKALLAGMMEAVEDIPAESILSGLPWNWEHYGDYLDSVEALAPALNIAGLVGHCAVRFYVMGERAVDGEPTDAEIDRMAHIVAGSVAAGAVGFSTSRLLMHTMPDGRNVPGTHAGRSELLRMAHAAAARGGCLIQCVPNLDAPGREMSLIEELASVGGTRVLFSVTAGDDDEAGARINAEINAICARGCDVNGISYPRASGVLVGLLNVLPWQAGAWQRLAGMPFEQRLAALDDTGFVEALIADAHDESATFPVDELFWLGDDVPDYRFDDRQRLLYMAGAHNEHPAGTFLRISAESGGLALFIARLFNHNRKAVETLIAGEHVLPALGDAGAHVGLIMDAGWCTYVLTDLVRDGGLFSIEEAVRRMTSAPARIIGLADRGRLASGMRADINVIDLDALKLSMPEYRRDFPGGAGRFTQGATGYRASVCNGAVVLENDTLTGLRPGRVLRH